MNHFQSAPGTTRHLSHWPSHRPSRPPGFPHVAASSAHDESFLEFVSEEPANLLGARAHPWTLLIVDDDPQVHEATRLALQRERIAQRPLAFLHAYSAGEAQAMIAQHPYIDAVLLDVIMETAGAGLKLAQTLRLQPATRHLRILLRSGQPGESEDEARCAAIGIDAFLPKNIQTRQRLVDTLHALLLGTGAQRPS